MTLPVLKRFSSKVNGVTYAMPGHTLMSEYLLSQTRKLASRPYQATHNVIQLAHASKAPDGAPIGTPCRFTLNQSAPREVTEATLDTMIADFRAIVASDEFVIAIKQGLFIGG